MTIVKEIKSFDSPEDFSGYRSNLTYRGVNNGWAGDETEKECFSILEGLKDYSKHSSQVEKIINEMQIDGLFTTGTKLPERSYWGNTPNVAAYLAGLPKNMNRRVHSDNYALNTPINVYLETIVSSGLSDAQIANRGIACLALAMALQSIRPVNLYVTNIARTLKNNNIYGVCVQVSSGNIDISRADFLLTSKSFSRKLGHECIFTMINCCDGLPLINGYENLVREYLGLTEDDLYITSGHLKDTEMLTDPVKWVKRMIEEKKYSFVATE